MPVCSSPTPARRRAIRDGVADADLLYNRISYAGAHGLDISAAVPGAVSLVGNVATDSTGNGIWMQSTTSGGILRTNKAYRNGSYDCYDESVGSARGGVANFWALDNRGVTDQPSVLCRP